MTTTEPTSAASPAAQSAPQRPLRLVRGELLKIFTTNTWWLLLIGAFLATAAAAATWILVGNNRINTAEDAANQTFDPPEGANQAQIDMMRQQFEISQDLSRTLHDVAAEIYTSGQFFGLLIALTVGILLMTNEYHHQTATATFLTTPRRSRVVFAKLGTAMLGAGAFWLFAAVLSVAAGAVFLAIKGYGPQLGEWPVLRAMLFNLLAYGLWGVLGLGLGTMIRSQIAAILIALLAYVLGSFVIEGVVSVLYAVLEWRWVYDVAIFWPGVASQVMISPEPPFPDAPGWWVGALVLIGYGLVFGLIGMLITRKRDVS